LYGGNNLASMAAFRSGEIRFMCHSAPSGLFFRGGDNYPDTEGRRWGLDKKKAYHGLTGKDYTQQFIE
ncbi:hypothetical protein, partial [Providencia rustigianii]|uniref:hypothetical protein n=1 Tax=Providencia rustigianii TaxID=158850 RepID=UPI0022407F76